MFTGIVEELGEVIAIEPGTDRARFTVRGPRVTEDAGHGASIAVNGVCLTVTETSAETRAEKGARAGGGTFTADVVAETLRRSNLGALTTGDTVNLERPVRLADRLGGHLVQGHADGVGRILAGPHAGAASDRAASDRAASDLGAGVEPVFARVSLPTGLERYVVEKGSIAVDGVSLTVVEVGTEEAAPEPAAGAWFTVSLIPTTLRLTTFGALRAGDAVNLEVDIVAKYLERLASASAGGLR